MKDNLLKTKDGIISLGEGDVAIGNVLTAGLLKKQSVMLISEEISWEEFDRYKLGVEKGDYINYMGHQSTANLVGMNANRVSLQADYGSELIVVQYDGPRLNEGATELPKDATLIPMRWKIRKVPLIVKLMEKIFR